MPPRPTILVVEDDEPLGRLYRSALTTVGFTVAYVRDGVDALRYLDQAVPDLVVLDLGLPRLDGRAVREEIRSHPDTQHIPIVVVTGLTETAKDLKSEYIARKPVSQDQLVAIVRRCLASPASTRC